MKIYTVVDVMCGVAVEAKSFRRLEVARAYRKRLRRGRNLEEDDVQLFENTIDEIFQRRNEKFRKSKRRSIL